MIILVTGPSRSGKSEWAEQLAHQSAKPVIYLATAQCDTTDPEWNLRIQKHQQRRPHSWQVWEVPVDLAAAIRSVPREHFVLVDALGNWVANCLDQEEKFWEQNQQDFLDAVQNITVDITIVGEEVGWGVVPAYAAGRLFRDRMGVLLRSVGTIGDRVYLVTGGYALDLSRAGEKLSQNLSH